MFLVLYFVVLFCGVSASQDADLGFCSQIYSMHQYCTSRYQSATRTIHGRTGKQGPRGIPGKSPVVDYDRINLTISQKILDLTAKMEKQVSQCCREGELENTHVINKLQNETQILRNKLDKLLTWHKASNGLFYKLFHNSVNYATAKSRCLEEDAILVCEGIRDKTVRSEIVKLIKAGNTDTWIGADDIVNEDRWVWADGTVAKSGDIDWADGQPDNSGENEDCAHYRPRYNWQVNDERCTDSNKKYLCESKI